MSFQITAPGDCIQRNKGKCGVVYVGLDFSYGLASGGGACIWRTRTGETYLPNNPELNITGPWIPDPPEGFEVRDRETYRAQLGDQLYESGDVKRWHKMSASGGVRGLTMAEADAKWHKFAPHYIASPVPPPFRISTHGAGVYETRDGRRAKVTGDGLPFWYGEVGPCKNVSWVDSGTERECNPHFELVRYISPLPETEKWEPSERRRVVIGGDSWKVFYYWSGEAMPFPVEREWTCGEKVDWRAVEVSQ